MVVACLALLACAGEPAEAPTPASGSSTEVTAATEPTADDTALGPVADVLEAVVTGPVGAYSLAVTVRSPDTGCDRYASWWEVVRPDGTLVYRRILNHSHVDEQPFTRSSDAPIAVQPTESLIVRAHLHPDGFGGQVLEGTMADGFTPRAATPGFAAALATAEPLPSDCWF